MKQHVKCSEHEEADFVLYFERCEYKIEEADSVLYFERCEYKMYFNTHHLALHPATKT